MSRPDSENLSDDRLVDAARTGEVRAFESLVSRYESLVMRVLALMGIRTQDREDVAQEVFIRVFRHLGGFRRGRPFRSWIYRISVNAAHDFRKRAGMRNRETSLQDDPDHAGPDTGSRGISRNPDLREDLLRAMSILTDRERAVFVLRELEGLETKEVSRSLGIASVTVRRHLGLARKRLRAALESRSK